MRVLFVMSVALKFNIIYRLNNGISETGRVSLQYNKLLLEIIVMLKYIYCKKTIKSESSKSKLNYIVQSLGLLPKVAIR